MSGVMTDNDNYYEVLGVEPGASRDELRSAYRERVETLEAAREGRASPSRSCRRTASEAARVRTAWNVLSDPFQRQRYDAQLERARRRRGRDRRRRRPGSAGRHRGRSSRVAQAARAAAAEATAPTGGDGKGKDATPQPSPRPEPTHRAPGGDDARRHRARGMALLFDISILMVIFFGVQPGPAPSRPERLQGHPDRHSSVNDLHDAKQSLNDAKSRERQGECTQGRQERPEGRQQERRSRLAARRHAEAARHVLQHAERQDQDHRLHQPGDDPGARLLYLVPMTRSHGTHARHAGPQDPGRDASTARQRLVSVAIRYVVPLFLAVAIPSLGPLLGLGLVLWGYRDRNRQGIHDKLAKTIVGRRVSLEFSAPRGIASPTGDE